MKRSEEKLPARMPSNHVASSRYSICLKESLVPAPKARPPNQQSEPLPAMPALHRLFSDLSVKLLDRSGPG